MNSQCRSNAGKQDILEFHLANSQREAAASSTILNLVKFAAASAGRNAILLFPYVPPTQAATTEQEIRDRVRSNKKEDSEIGALLKKLE